MAWEQRCELRYAEIVGGLKTTEEGSVDICWVCGPDAVAGSDDAGVDACAIAVYCIPSVGVDNIGVCGRDTRQISSITSATGLQVAISMICVSRVSSTPA